ncbi:hypothetical protein, partial [Enterocloster sp.]|uniref:hypothetical protein n=1 Tax=Enterocloster sp. TaxID=2719315 RepID=UPI0030783CDA
YHFGASVIHGQRSNILRLPGISYGISSCIGVVVPWLILVSLVTGRFAFRFSAGERQRLALARALVRDPQ